MSLERGSNGDRNGPDIVQITEGSKDLFVGNDSDFQKEHLSAESSEASDY